MRPVSKVNDAESVMTRLVSVFTLALILCVFTFFQAQARTIVVAVIDTGLDLTHPHFTDHVWQNSGEMGVDVKGNDKRFNGLDDDQNGYVDDINGFDFSNNKSTVDDTNGHGTHVAGIITGQDRDHAPALCQECVIMPLKYYSSTSSPSENIRSLIKAFEYALKMKADIINYSGGGYGSIEEERRALKSLEIAGVPVVAAAGNFGSDNDRKPYYPASYPLKNIIAVGALATNGQRFGKSNDGTRSVHALALGEKVKSAAPHFKYTQMSGSSQAAAVLTGWIAQSLTATTQMQQARLNKREDWLDHLVKSESTNEPLKKAFSFVVKPQSLPLLAIDEQDPSRSLAQLKPQ